jgi:iron complex transport system substrate-binding protein
MIWRLVTLVGFALAASVASATDLPKVVSVNVCTDQFVMLLADPAQVLSLTVLADDPQSSALSDRAGAFSKNNGRAESIALEQPDIVVASQYSDPALINMLREINIEVVQFPVITSLAEIPLQLRQFGAVLGREAIADDMATAVEAQLRDFPALDDTAPLAAFFYPNGYALGEGTLSHDILAKGGARNLSVTLGMQGGGRLALEQVVLNQPDILISAPNYRGFSRSEEMTTHPALAHFPVLNSTPDWACGTPNALRAVSQVAAMVAQLRGETDTANQ